MQEDSTLISKAFNWLTGHGAARGRPSSCMDLAPTPLSQVLDEFLQTEATYLDDIHLVMREFFEPLAAPVLPEALHAALFANLVDELEPLHHALEEALRGIPNALPEERVGLLAEAFRELLPDFPCYSTYCANYAYVADALAQVMDVKAAADIILAAEARLSSRGAKLSALLFRPVQRMCVYPLLFKEVLKQQDENVEIHRAALHQTMMTMQTVVMQVNEEVRALETQLQHLQLLAGSMLQPSFAFQRDLGSVMKRETRVLLHEEAKVTMRQVLPHSMWRKARLLETTWCLFTDVLMIHKRQKGGAVPKDGSECTALLPLLSISVDPKPGTDILALHRRLPLRPGSRREKGRAYEWHCDVGSETNMLKLANRLEERKAALRQELFDEQAGAEASSTSDYGGAAAEEMSADIAARCSLVSPRRATDAQADGQRFGLDRASSGPQFVWHREQGLATIASTRHSMLPSPLHAGESSGGFSRRTQSLERGRRTEGLAEDSNDSDGNCSSPRNRLVGQRTGGSLPAVTERSSMRDSEGAPPPPATATATAAAAAAATAAGEALAEAERQRRRAERAETEATQLREQVAKLKKQNSEEAAVAAACKSPRCSVTVTPRQGPEQRLIELNLQIARLTEEARQLSLMIAPPVAPPRSPPRSPQSAERKCEPGLDDPKLSALLLDARQAAQRGAAPMASPEPPVQRIRVELRRAPVTRDYGLAIQSTAGQSHVVAEVDPDGQADVAGVRVGDIVEEIGGHVMVAGETPVPYLPPRSSDAAVELVLRRPPPPPESAMSTPPRKAQPRCRVSPTPDAVPPEVPPRQRHSKSPMNERTRDGATPPAVPPRSRLPKEDAPAGVMQSPKHVPSAVVGRKPSLDAQLMASPSLLSAKATEKSQPGTPFMAKVSNLFGKSMEKIGVVILGPNTSVAPPPFFPPSTSANKGAVKTADAARVSAPAMGDEAAKQQSLDEQEKRRQTWIAFHLANGEEDEARALGWDSEEEEEVLTKRSRVSSTAREAPPADGAPIRAAEPRKLSDGFWTEDSFVAEPSRSKIGMRRERSCTDASMGQTEASEAAEADMAQAEAADAAASLAAAAGAEASRIWQVAMAVTEARAERVPSAEKDAEAEARAEQARAALAREARAEAAELLHLSGASVAGADASASSAPAPAPEEAAAGDGGDDDDDDDWDTEADFVAEIKTPGSSFDPGAEERAARGAADRGRALLGAAGLDDEEVAPPPRYIGLQAMRQSTDAALYEAIAEANAAAMAATASAAAADEAGARATTALNAATKCADTAPSAPPSAPGSREPSLRRLPLTTTSAKRLPVAPAGLPPAMGDFGSSRALNGGAGALSSTGRKRQGPAVVTLEHVAANDMHDTTPLTPEEEAKRKEQEEAAAERRAEERRSATALQAVVRGKVGRTVANVMATVTRASQAAPAEEEEEDDDDKADQADAEGGALTRSQPLMSASSP